jgi:hypothetical protein
MINIKIIKDIQTTNQNIYEDMNKTMFKINTFLALMSSLLIKKIFAIHIN